MSAPITPTRAAEPGVDPRGLRVDGGRLLRRLHELGSVGSTGDGGCCRLALTEADRTGRDLVSTWMRDLGLDVTVDAVGNVVACRPGRRAGPPVMTGSHIDTVRTGGLYDGNLGVLAGLEVVETLIEHDVETEHGVAVAFFTDEEGSRFAPDMLGSLVYVGGMSVEEARDAVAIDGARLGDELDAIGYAGATPCPGTTPVAFVELHIEQGPVLEHEGYTIGAVTEVQGIAWYEVTITGQSNHAGTTPIDHRHDPLLTAARIAVEVRELCARYGSHQVGTVGKIDVHPNLINVVPARATFTVDLRNTDAGALRLAEVDLWRFCDAVAAEEGVTVDVRRLARFDPVPFDTRVVEWVEATAVDLGHSVRRLPSGAGHDAQMLARVCPSGMIFVPSVGGISHNPAEHTDPVDLTAGADTLLQTLLGVAGVASVRGVPVGPGWAPVLDHPAAPEEQ
jgi:beta-ureidopropionase / N-carbamoyl-L-amino-acid hydrolase